MFNFNFFITMAKGNMFLGMSRGKVGSVVMYRQSGQQIVRTRATNVKNPKTEGQLIQRAIAKTVALAYSVGQEIFNHSFQNQKGKAGNSNRFRSINMRKLREAVVSDVNGESIRARVAGRDSVTPPAWPFRISEGTLVQSLFTVAPVADDAVGEVQATMAAPTDGETVAQYVERLGLAAGDIFTICVLAAPESESDPTLPQGAQFAFVRCIVKPDLGSVTTLASAATFSDVFLMNYGGAGLGSTARQIAAKTIVTPVTIFDIATGNVGAMGVIRSREDVKLRSTSDMVVGVMPWGIQSAFIAAAWGETASLGNSSLILEGGGF